MSDLAPAMTDLKGKIEQLVKSHQQLKLENDKLIADNEGLKKINGEQKAKIEGLEKSIKELGDKNNTEQNTIITDTKLKINELVQEIDHCIALLNK